MVQEQISPSLYGVFLAPKVHQIHQTLGQIRESSQIHIPFRKEIFIFSSYSTQNLPFENEESIKSPEGRRPRIDRSSTITNY